jgi:hypothetical protein
MPGPHCKDSDVVGLEQNLRAINIFINFYIVLILSKLRFEGRLSKRDFLTLGSHHDSQDEAQLVRASGLYKRQALSWQGAQWSGGLRLI